VSIKKGHLERLLRKKSISDYREKEDRGGGKKMGGGGVGKKGLWNMWKGERAGDS